MNSNELLLLNFLLEDKKPGAAPIEQFLGRALRTLRVHLGADAALIEELVDGAHVARPRASRAR